MSKKFSIVQSIDLNKMHNEIRNYMSQTDCSEPYLFMSEKTIEEVLRECPETYPYASKVFADRCVMGIYTGYKVFVDNDLELGMVEIR